MAVSGSFNYDRTGAQIIAAALRKLQVLAEGQSATTNQETTGLEALNLLLKAWQSKGMPLWQLRDVYVYPIHDTNSILLGPSGGHASTELIRGTLTADAAAAATSLSVDTDEGTTANSDAIGIELDSGNIFWTTISSGGGTSTLTIASGLTTAAASGNRFYAYTAKAQRPVKIIEGWIVGSTSQNRRPLRVVAESELKNTGNLTTESEIINISYRPLLTDGQLQFWPRFQDGAQYLELRAQYGYDDMDATTDTLAFPQTFLLAIVYNLANLLAPEYGYPMESRMALKGEAGQFMTDAFDSIAEMTSIRILPQMEMQ